MPSFDINRAPGHLLRRAQQIVVSLFYSQTQNRVTPIQYALMSVLADSDGIDQVTLAGKVALDASTSGNTLERLARRGWIERHTDPLDRRRRILSLTTEGRANFVGLIDDVETIQHLLLDALDPKERVVFMRLLTKLVEKNNALSRVPLRDTDTDTDSDPQ